MKLIRKARRFSLPRVSSLAGISKGLLSELVLMIDACNSHAALTARVKELEEIQKNSAKRDGNWIDQWGACKVCDGELPAGHTNDCDVFKLEDKVRSLQARLESAEKELAVLREVAEAAKFHKCHTTPCLICAALAALPKKGTTT